MGMDPKIRFVTIMDSEGRLMHGGQREGIVNHLNPDESKISLQHAIYAWGIRTKFENKIGAAKYALVEYEKIKRISIPLDDKHLIYITIESDADHSLIIERIMRLKSEFTG